MWCQLHGTTVAFCLFGHCCELDFTSWRCAPFGPQYHIFLPHRRISHERSYSLVSLPLLAIPLLEEQRDSRESGTSGLFTGHTGRVRLCFTLLTAAEARCSSLTNRCSQRRA